MNRDIINIKGTRNGLVICLDSNQDFDELKKTLKEKMESARGFFKGAKFTFHLGYSTLTAEKTKELQDICCEQGLVPDANITWPSQNGSGQGKKQILNVSPKREASSSLPSIGLTEADKKPCLMINRSLRSGQKINYHGNVVVTGDVNPGSEITATGDILVFGSLRGIVHAGAGGNQTSIIMACRLNPLQLRIASTISRPPENNPAGSCPEIARLQNGRMITEPYLTK